MSFQSRAGLPLISLNVSSSEKVVFFKVFEYLCCSLVLGPVYMEGGCPG